MVLIEITRMCLIMEKKVRGDVINSWFKYIKKKWGQDGLDSVIQEAKLDAKIKEGNFYPIEDYENLLKWVRETHGHEYLRDGGKFIVSNFGLLGFLIRFVSIKMIISKMGPAMKEFFNFSGVDAVVKGDDFIQVHVYDICTSPDICQAIWGACEGALKLTNTPGAIVKTKCRHKGDDYCEYTWDGR